MAQQRLNSELCDQLRKIAVVPVLTIERVGVAVPLAEALVAGGLAALEVTLRTPDALAAIEAIARHVPAACVGAGTVLSAGVGTSAVAAGAAFLVSPGATETLLAAAAGWPTPFLPGAATASEAMRLSELGYTFQKFFPAEQAGGIAALKALAAPLQDIVFCPTGGIGAANAAAYLGCANVACVGGSWVAPAAMIEARDWAGITRLARVAAALRHRGA